MQAIFTDILHLCTVVLVECMSMFYIIFVPGHHIACLHDELTLNFEQETAPVILSFFFFYPETAFKPANETSTNYIMSSSLD